MQENFLGALKYFSSPIFFKGAEGLFWCPEELLCALKNFSWNLKEFLCRASNTFPWGLNDSFGTLRFFSSLRDFFGVLTNFSVEL